MLIANIPSQVVTDHLVIAADPTLSPAPLAKAGPGIQTGEVNFGF